MKVGKREFQHACQEFDQTSTLMSVSNENERYTVDWLSYRTWQVKRTKTLNDIVIHIDSRQYKNQLTVRENP